MIIVLSGPVHGGKTTLIQKSLSRWASRGLRFGGFLSLSVRNARGETEYDFLGLQDGRRLPFLRRKGEAGWEQVGSFYFVPRTLELACSLIASADPAEVLIVDEAGPLELAGGGLWPALREFFSRPSPRALLVVREDILEEMTGMLPRSPAPLVIDVRDPNASLLLERSLLGPEIP
jgi:nucleoside-triphosphatase THEP1